MTSVAVTSRSFSNHPLLRSELCKRYPQAAFNESGKTLSGDELIAFLKDHDSAIIGLEKLTAEIVSALPRLKVVSRFGVGLDSLDLDAMKQSGIRLACTVGANKRSVAELVIAFAINMLRHIPLANHELKSGVWQQRKGRQLSGTTVGILGLGAVGKELALLLDAFGCKRLAFDIADQSAFCAQHHVSQVDMETVLQASDIVSVHLPLNADTRNILDAHYLAMMKPHAILINTARGGLVDEAALKTLLMNKQLAAAAFDVFATEPPVDTSLLSLPQFFATPHIGGSTEEAILAMGKAAIEGLDNAVLPK